MSETVVNVFELKKTNKVGYWFYKLMGKVNNLFFDSIWVILYRIMKRLEWGTKAYSILLKAQCRIEDRKFTGSKTINNINYRLIVLPDMKGRKALADLGVEYAWFLKPVYEVNSSRYIIAYSYYDGGSDGREESEYFWKTVEQTLPQK